MADFNTLQKLGLGLQLTDRNTQANALNAINQNNQLNNEQAAQAKKAKLAKLGQMREMAVLAVKNKPNDPAVREAAQQAIQSIEAQELELQGIAGQVETPEGFGGNGLLSASLPQPEPADPTKLTAESADAMNTAIDTNLVPGLSEEDAALVSPDLYADPRERRKKAEELRAAKGNPKLEKIDLTDRIVFVDPNKPDVIVSEFQKGTKTTENTKKIVQVFTKEGDSFSAFADEQGGFTDQNGNKISIPEGAKFSTSSVTGTPEETGLTTKGAGMLDEKLINIDSSIAGLESTVQTFDPSYLTLPTQLYTKGLKAADKLGIELSPENAELLKNYSTFQQDAIATVNATIKAITGAQMSEKEADRIRKQIPDPENDSPKQFEAKLKNSLKQSKLAQARWRWMTKNGIRHDFKSNKRSPVSLDAFEGMFESRAEEIQKELKAGGQGEDESFANALAQAKQEFEL